MSSSIGWEKPHRQDATPQTARGAGERKALENLGVLRALAVQFLPKSVEPE
jgi:hypothetical protein